MQLRPGEEFAVVRQLEDPFDLGTYYVQAKIRDAKTDELISTLNLDDSGNQRHTALWTVVFDASGLGRYIDIETMVYTNAGRTTVSEVHRRENQVYLIEERNQNMGGGGSDIDYKKISQIVNDATKNDGNKDADESTQKNADEIKKGITEGQAEVLRIVGEGFDSVKEAIANIEKPEKLTSVLESIESAKDAVVSAIEAKDVTEVTDLTPVLEKLDGMTLKAFQDEAQNLIAQVREIVGSDFVKMFQALKGIREFLNAIPFIVMNGSERKKIEDVEEVSEEKPKRKRMIGTRGFVVPLILYGLAALFVLAGPIAFFTQKAEAPSVEEAPRAGDTVGSLQLWVSTTTPSAAYTQRTKDKAIRITGLNSCDTIDTDSNGYLSCGIDSSGAGGSGTIGTSTVPVAGNLAYWTSGSALSDVATGTLTESVSGLELSATRGLVGGASILSLSTGYEIPLTASSTNWNGFYDVPSTRITAGTNLSWSGNTLNVTGGNNQFIATTGFLSAATTTDAVRANTFVASSTTGTSTFAGNISLLGLFETNADINVLSEDSLNGTNRINLYTYENTFTQENNEVIRYHAKEYDSKIGEGYYIDALNPDRSKVWSVAHKYLTYFVSDTFTPADVSTSTDIISITNNINDSEVNAVAASFTTTGTLPSPLLTDTVYYVRDFSPTTVKVFPTLADANAQTNLVNLTDQGSGTHTYIPDNDADYNNHQHWSMEVTDDAGLDKFTRFSIPYDLDITEMEITLANLTLVDATHNGKKGGLLKLNNDVWHSGAFEFYPEVVWDNKRPTPTSTPPLFGFRMTLENGNTLPTLSATGTSFIGLASPIISGDSTLTFGEHFVGQITSGNTSQLNLGYIADGSNVTSMLVRATNSEDLTFGTTAFTTALVIGNNGTTTLSQNFTATGIGKFGESITAASPNSGISQIFARTSANATDRGGIMRVGGEIDGLTTYKGGFWAYDPLNNYVLFGTHDAANEATSSDITTYRLARSTGNIDILRPLVFNEDSADIDFRMEGNNDVNQFFLDASTDRIGIGTSTPTTKLTVVGTSTFSGQIVNLGARTLTTGNAVCYLASGEYVFAGGTSCVTSSERWKQDIEKLDSEAWKGLLGLDVKDFNYKPEYADNVRDAGGKRLGVIAEEVEQIDPRLVQYGADGKPLTVHFDGLITLLIQAVQAQQEQIESLGGTAKKSAEENYQWIIIALLFCWIVRLEIKTRK